MRCNRLESGSESLLLIGLQLFVLFCLVGGYGSGAGRAMGQDSEVSKKDSSVLKKSLDRTWYKSDEDKLLPVAPMPRESIDASDRMDSLHVPESSSNYTGPSTFWETLTDLLSHMFSFWGYFVLLALIVVLFLFVLLLFRGGRMRSYTNKKSANYDNVARDQAKVTDLPFELEQSTLGLLAQADRFRSQGDYAKAMVYLFSHVLVELDAHGLIRLERGKTNRTYLRELRSRESERKFTSYLVRWFEHVFFGKNEMDRDAFEKIWSQIPNFENQLKISAEKVELGS